MPNILLSGPAGAGKTSEARRILNQSALPVISLDFQSIYAALLLLERLPDGRYPERLDKHQYVLPMVQYLRQAAITGATEMELEVVYTNSQGRPPRRDDLLRRLGPGAAEVVIDPGIDVVRRRLVVDGALSDQCEEAIDRWYK